MVSAGRVTSGWDGELRRRPSAFQGHLVLPTVPIQARSVSASTIGSCCPTVQNVLPDLIP